MATKKKGKPAKKNEEDQEGGMSLDDAFSDDDDVEYAAPTPKKAKKKAEEDEDDFEEEQDTTPAKEIPLNHTIQVKQSKSIDKIKKGDFVTINGKKLEVDAHYVFEDYKTTKEMIIELFDPKTEADFQLRYFNDQVPQTLKFYELKVIVYEEVLIDKIEW